MNTEPDRRKIERVDQTASDIYFAALRDTGSHVEAARILETVMLAEERAQAE